MGLQGHPSLIHIFLLCSVLLNHILVHQCLQRTPSSSSTNWKFLMSLSPCSLRVNQSFFESKSCLNARDSWSKHPQHWVRVLSHWDPSGNLLSFLLIKQDSHCCYLVNHLPVLPISAIDFVLFNVNIIYSIFFFYTNIFLLNRPVLVEKERFRGKRLWRQQVLYFRDEFSFDKCLGKILKLEFLSDWFEAML